MNIKLLKKLFLTIGIIVVSIYLLFLILPFILNPVLNGYMPQIQDEIKKSTALNINLSDLRLVTTPKLTTGIKLKQLLITLPNNKEVMNLKNAQIKMSLLPLLAKKIELDLIKAENIKATLGLNKDGSLEIEKYISQPETTETNNTETAAFVLPFGLKLSNHLPDIKVGNYNITFTDNSNSQQYTISGTKFEITDFILNKSIKIMTDGNIVLRGREQFKYDLKINNRIMPDITLNELVFAPKENKTEKKQEANINILEILNGLYNNNVTLNIESKIRTEKQGNNLNLNGYAKLNNISISPNGLKIPPSNMDLKFRGHKINIDSELYTAINEISTINGSLATGKNTKIDVTLKSQAELANLLNIVKAFATIFNIKDLQTISANGKIDANFNIKSDMKKIQSNGYLKIPSAKIFYGLYNIALENINTNISLKENDITIHNISFSILNHPLNLHGTIKSDSTANIHLSTQNLSLKGLLIALGQAPLLKENAVNSGTISLSANVIGKLNAIKPSVNVMLNNINIKNIPSNTSLMLPCTTLDLNSDGKTFGGKAKSEFIKVVNPAITISIPETNLNITDKNIMVEKTVLTADKINLMLEGCIKNYLQEKMTLKFTTSGDIKSTLSGDVNMLQQTLNLMFSAPQKNQIIVPMFNKSKMIFSGNTSISGNMTNPILNGTFLVSSLVIPEIPLNIDNLTAKLNGNILKGSATIGKFASGGIIATNLSTNFLMKNENFYLNNLAGKAFDGNINGQIVYNMSNAKTNIIFAGNGLNAKDAIAGAVGIKNALTGTLNFDTKLSLLAKDYNEMMKSMDGNFNFKITNGSFGTIGKLENFLSATNIVTNGVLKSTIATASKLATLQNTAKFDYIQGSLNFKNGWANINSIKSTGATLAYYVTGKYNLLNGTTNVIILGRLDSSVVALLGPLGELSTTKLLSYIPKFGAQTASIVNALTTNPRAENTSALPKLSGSNSYKDFKVVYNGGLESKNSVKSFKWLTKVDMSAIQQQNITDTIKAIKTSGQEDVTNTVNKVKDAVNSVKAQQELIKNSAEELKNLFKF